MDSIATEIMPLTPENMAAAALEANGTAQADRRGPRMNRGRRKSARWEFDGVVEFRDGPDSGPEFGTLGNIGAGGLCMKCDRDMAVGGVLDLAIHTEISTLTGSGTVVGSHEAEECWWVRVRFDI